MKHYVYKLTETKTNEFYYGVRTCKCDPKDDNYLGSMTSWKPTKSNLSKELVGEFDNRDDANDYEKELITQFISNPLNRNYHTGAGLSFYGKTHSKENIEKLRNSMADRHKGKDNPFYGRKHTEKTIEKIRAFRLGNNHTEETKEKMSKSAKSVDRKGYRFKKFQQRKKVMFLESGEIYISIYQASKKLGVSRSYVRNHLNTKFRLLSEEEN
jgi:hypothetical protein|tara:strand:+ start:676 stop:1311 length:636 start_codon:yes stop_codon:yes gene_type:complete